MKIKYRHWEQPDKEKIYDSVQDYRFCPSLTADEFPLSQIEFDIQQLKNCRRKKEKGIMLEFTVVDTKDFVDRVAEYARETSMTDREYIELLFECGLTVKDFESLDMMDYVEQYIEFDL